MQVVIYWLTTLSLKNVHFIPVEAIDNLQIFLEQDLS